MKAPRRPAWESLFEQALSIISQAQSSVGVDVAWSFGGGTALMLQIEHRDSFDIDIFIDDPQFLPLLNPNTQDYRLEMSPDDYQTDGTRALKLVFSDLGEIDFICAAQLTENATALWPVSDAMVRMETAAEIVAKKIVYRGASLQPRDMFDIACVSGSLGNDYVINALEPFQDKAMAALAVARNMDPTFATAVMQKLQYRPRFAKIPEDAQAITIALLETVCGSR